METAKRIIIGIDPGSRYTGYGVIWTQGNKQGLITYGYVQCKQTQLNQRLYQIHRELSQVIAKHQPDEAAIEQVFTCINPQSALKLGQARGAALTATAKYALPLAEYSARQIKKSVTGYGAADKTQIQHMVRSMLHLTTFPQADAADALAIALCHAFHQSFTKRIHGEV